MFCRFVLSRGLCQRNVPSWNTSHFVVRLTRNHHRCIWSRKKLLPPERIDYGKLQHVKVQKCNFRTTQSLHVPPYLALLLRPLLRVSAFVVGRRLKKWWANKSDKEKEEYKQWFWERNNVFLGCFGLYGFILFIYYVSHLQTDPLTKRSRFIIFNKEQEKQLGDIILDFHLKNHKKDLVPMNHPAYKRLLRVIEKILMANKDLNSIKETQWSLTVINVPLANSYILPGGNIFVSLGILKIVENDDQLGIVLTHEIAHSLLSHSLEMLSDQLFWEFLMLIPMLLAWTLLSYIVAPAIQFIGEQIVNIIYRLPYNRILENEADQVGIKLAARACIDVREAVVFWAMLRTLTEMRSLPQEMPWISTHPAHGEREKNINKAIPSALELRRRSGCARLPATDPRDEFYKRSAKEQERIFRERGIII